MLSTQNQRKKLMMADIRDLGEEILREIGSNAGFKNEKVIN
jgi:hypothetical protein